MCYYPALRTGFSNTLFFPWFFYPAVRTGSSNTRFFFYPAVRTGSSNTRFFLSWSLAPDLRSVKTILAGNLRSFIVYFPEFS